MEWVQVLLVLLFIIFPLLEALGSRRRPPADQEPSASLPDVPMREPAALADDDTSAWDAWFGPNAGEARQVEAGQGEEKLVEQIQPIEAISLEQFDEVPEPVEIDRAAEHDRFHSRYLAPVHPSTRRETLPARLRNPGELRRAILLAEVLGPPRALR